MGIKDFIIPIQKALLRKRMSMGRCVCLDPTNLLALPWFIKRNRKEFFFNFATFHTSNEFRTLLVVNLTSILWTVLKCKYTKVLQLAQMHNNYNLHCVSINSTACWWKQTVAISAISQILVPLRFTKIVWLKQLLQCFGHNKKHFAPESKEMLILSL